MVLLKNGDGKGLMNWFLERGVFGKWAVILVGLSVGRVEVV